MQVSIPAVEVGIDAEAVPVPEVDWEETRVRRRRGKRSWIGSGVCIFYLLSFVFWSLSCSWVMVVRGRKWLESFDRSVPRDLSHVTAEWEFSSRLSKPTLGHREFVRTVIKCPDRH